MASNQTTNYQLNQWESTDQVLRTDFNADNAKLDAALAALDSGKADQSALNALSSTVSSLSANVTANLTKLTFGTYVGNGEASRTISLGFTPLAIFVIEAGGRTFFAGGSAQYFGGLAIGSYSVSEESEIVKIVTDGFMVYHDGFIRSNYAGYRFHYIAFS